MATTYVSTYAKYNNGSLDGTTLDFSDYSDSEGFLQACAEYHDDETEPEFMFQDFEDLPEHLQGESLSSSDIDSIYEWLEITDKIESWDDNDWLQAHNTYCEANNDYDSMIHAFDDDFFDTYFANKPIDAARAVHFGSVNWNDDYITFNGYGNLVSYSSIEDAIDKEEITAHILENSHLYDL